MAGILIFSIIINVHVYFEHSVYKKPSLTFSQLKPFNVRNFNFGYRNVRIDDYKEQFSDSEYIKILNIIQS